MKDLREQLAEMGFFHNETETILAICARQSFDPILFGQFIMNERFKRLMAKMPTIQRMIEVGGGGD